MLGSLPVIVLLAAVLAALLWLALRAWRIGRPVLRWAAIIAFGLPSLLLAAVIVLGLLGLYKIYGPHPVAIEPLQVQPVGDRVARGRHLADFMCTRCHSVDEQLPLSGSEDMAVKFNFPLGSAIPPNLTPGGPLKDWSDGEIWRAIRDGIGREGQLLPVMSPIPDHNLSDEDLQALIAYLRSQPAVRNDTPPESPSLLFVLLIETGLGSSDAAPPEHIAAVPVGPTDEYARYIIGLEGCRDCHGPDFGGGTSATSPHGPNLTALVPHWTEDQFARTLRTGVDPYDHALNPTLMPWKQLGRLDDVELEALYNYLRSLPLAQH